jgi:LPS-assembly protein
LPVLRLSLLTGALAMAAGGAWAQAASDAEVQKNAPTYLQGDRISGHTELDTVIEGNAQLRKGDTTIEADRLEYYQPSDLARATGNVRVERGGNEYTGPLLELKVERFEGFFQQPEYHFKQGDAHGNASRADFLDESHTIVHDATYTTCRRLPGPSWMPDWILRAGTISLDNDEDVGIATDAYVSFKGVPILPVLPISFPLSEKRKSGLLPLTIDPVNSLNGMTLTQPYYWNIAPNRDATITPTFMAARGVNLGLEFRYLEPSYNGALHADYMPSDQLRQADRWGLAWTQNNVLSTGIPAIGNVGLAVNINRVSDDNYWQDFTGTDSLLTQRLLPGDVQATWSKGGASASVRMQQWQTLQAVDSPIIPPYNRLPQLAARYEQNRVNGFDWSVEGDYTQFQADSSLTRQPNAQRGFAMAQISRPWVAPQGFITPKLQLHTASYQFDAMLANGSQTANSTVPTFSLDSGLVFERNTTLWGRSFLQTLEPRAFYVYTPFHDQSLLPNYDTGAADFNFASIYTENAYVGNDKISDNNLLTLGLSSRFLDAETGAQYARFGIAQRIRFQEQMVTIDNSTPPAKSGISDLLLGASLNLSDRWALDSTTQYNPLTDQSMGSTVTARYSPSPYRVINAAYRFQREVSEQVDLSWQWPINDLWGDRGRDLGSGQGQGDGRYYAVGRMNYSLDQSAMVDTILGVEYDAGCWLGRVVFSRTQTSPTNAIQRVMFQLELVGFSRLGIDPLETLKQNISRYQNLRGASSTGTGTDRNSNNN